LGVYIDLIFRCTPCIEERGHRRLSSAGFDIAYGLAKRMTCGNGSKEHFEIQLAL
jgi:hypothetical protein